MIKTITYISLSYLYLLFILLHTNVSLLNVPTGNTIHSQGVVSALWCAAAAVPDQMISVPLLSIDSTYNQQSYK